jgi:eukaryotic-like serine/threonine-protein kinase
LETNFLESQPQFSPDGRWVAYMSNKSGRQEVYATQFPTRDHETRVSTAGGTTLPRWNRNGREIFYVAPDGMLTAATVDGGTEQIEVGAPRPLFTVPLVPTRLARLDSYPYDVTPDGQRILVNSFIDEVMPPITLVVNWTTPH